MTHRRLVRHRRKPAELCGFGHFFDDAPMTHFYTQPIESVEMTHESSKIYTHAPACASHARVMRTHMRLRALRARVYAHMEKFLNLSASSQRQEALDPKKCVTSASSDQGGRP